MKLSALLDELIKIEAQCAAFRMEAFQSLRDRLTAEAQAGKGDIPFERPARPAERQSDIDTVMGKHVEPEHRPAQPLGDIRDPLAKSMGDLITTKQFGMIRGLCRELAIDADEECDSLLRCRTEELSKKAASSFIEHLQGLQKEQGAKTA